MTHAFFVLLRREFQAILISPIFYILFFCFSVLMGYNFLISVDSIVNGYAKGMSFPQVFTFLFFFWMSILIFAPVLTMRLLSEEYKSGTIETILTAPVKEWDVILAKFFGAFGTFAILWIPTLIGYAAFQYLTQNSMPFLWGPNLLAVLLVFLIGGFYISIGLFTSSLTRNQIIAAISSFTIILVLFFLGFLVYNIKSEVLREPFQYIFSLDHMQKFSSGLFDTRPIVFYLSGILFFLTLSQRVLVSKRLKG